MAENNCVIYLGKSEYDILKKDFDLVIKIQKYCQKITGSKIELSAYEAPNSENFDKIAPKIGVYISPYSKKVNKIQLFSCGLEDAIFLQDFDELKEIDLRKNNLKGLPESVCELIEKNNINPQDTVIYVFGNPINSESEHGIKTDGLFSIFFLNKKYCLIDELLVKD